MSEKNKKLAFVFPGQGSQAMGMMSQLAKAFPLVKQVFEQASDVLSFDLWHLVQQGPVATLNQTDNTQPAMLAAGVAMWRVWLEQSTIVPYWMAGHSLGEYSALVCSQAMRFEDGIALVATRGRLMQQAVPAGVGAMAAIIGLTDQQLIDICADNADPEVVCVVNFNAPGQVVIAGHIGAVESVMSVAKDAGAKITKKLPVSVPSHCSLMQSAAEKLYQTLVPIKIKTPQITLIHNVDSTSHSSATQIKIALREQLFNPVHWVKSISYVRAQNVSCFVECGPGKVLTGLNKRIAKDASHYAMYDPLTLDKVLEQVNEQVNG